MTHPLFPHLDILTETERAARRAEMQWLHDAAEKRRPERNRGLSDYGLLPAIAEFVDDD